MEELDLEPRVSIVTVCLNAKDHISVCLASVAAQTYRHVEHIVIDGGSTDGTIEVVKCATHISTFLSEKDNGIYDAMNKGIARATGEFIIFLNADDYFANSNVISSAVSEILRQPEGDVYYGSLEVRKRDGTTHIHRPGPPEAAAETMVCGCLPHQSTLARRRVFHQTNGFDISYRFHADHDWFLKVIHDPGIRLCRIDTVIGSFFEGGLSSQLERTQPEVHQIQNTSPLYASTEWDRRRIELYQKAYLEERLESARLRGELAKQRKGCTLFRAFKKLFSRA